MFARQLLPPRYHPTASSSNKTLIRSESLDDTTDQFQWQSDWDIETSTSSSYNSCLSSHCPDLSIFEEDFANKYNPHSQSSTSSCDGFDMISSYSKELYTDGLKRKDNYKGLRKTNNISEECSIEDEINSETLLQCKLNQASNKNETDDDVTNQRCIYLHSQPTETRPKVKRFKEEMPWVSKSDHQLNHCTFPLPKLPLKKGKFNRMFFELLSSKMDAENQRTTPPLCKIKKDNSVSRVFPENANRKIVHRPRGSRKIKFPQHISDTKASFSKPEKFIGKVTGDYTPIRKNAMFASKQNPKLLHISRSKEWKTKETMSDRPDKFKTFGKYASVNKQNHLRSGKVKIISKKHHSVSAWEDFNTRECSYSDSFNNAIRKKASSNRFYKERKRKNSSRFASTKEFVDSLMPKTHSNQQKSSAQNDEVGLLVPKAKPGLEHNAAVFNKFKPEDETYSENELSNHKSKIESNEIHSEEQIDTDEQASDTGEAYDNELSESEYLTASMFKKYKLTRFVCRAKQTILLNGKYNDKNKDIPVTKAMIRKSRPGSCVSRRDFRSFNDKHNFGGRNAIGLICNEATKMFLPHGDYKRAHKSGNGRCEF